jgi:hypothetical protein
MSHCSLLRKSGPKLTDVVEHFREGETIRSFSIFFLSFLSGCTPTATKDANAHFFIL